MGKKAKLQERLANLTQKLEATSDEEKKARIQARIDACQAKLEGGGGGGGGGGGFKARQEKRMENLAKLKERLEKASDEQKAKILGRVAKRRAKVAEKLVKMKEKIEATEEENKKLRIAKKIEAFQEFHDGLAALGEAEPCEDDSSGSDDSDDDSDEDA